MKIGFVSANWRCHPEIFQTPTFYGYLNSDEFQVYFYDNTLPNEKDMPYKQKIIQISPKTYLFFAFELFNIVAESSIWIPPLISTQLLSKYFFKLTIWIFSFLIFNDSVLMTEKALEPQFFSEIVHCGANGVQIQKVG
mgnify:CR=1 FL=1